MTQVELQVHQGDGGCISPGPFSPNQTKPNQAEINPKISAYRLAPTQFLTPAAGFRPGVPGALSLQIVDSGVSPGLNSALLAESVLRFTRMPCTP